MNSTRGPAEWHDKGNDVFLLQERNEKLGATTDHRENYSEGKVGKLFSEILDETH